MNLAKIDYFVEEQVLEIRLYLLLAVEIEMFNLRARHLNAKRMERWMMFAKEHGTVLTDTHEYRELILMERANYETHEMMELYTKYRDINENLKLFGVCSLK